MEIFYSSDIVSDTVRLDREESGHCVKVMRHRAGDAVDVIDGEGGLLHCTLIDADPREAVLRIDSREDGWGALPYHLILGVCPTKNADRFEWAVEKATEFGADAIVPLIGDRSERRVFKPERARRIALSATKQSLKARIPAIPDAMPVHDFLAGVRSSGSDGSGLDGTLKLPDGARGDSTSHSSDLLSTDGQLRLIACCFNGEDWQRVSMRAALESVPGATSVTVLIGPEGDFSLEEVAAARAAGFIPVHLGTSRLRTETAAVAAAAFVYYHFL